MIAGVFAVYNHNDGTLSLFDNPQTFAYYGADPKQIQQLIDLYNAGERWIDVSDSITHADNAPSRG